MFQALENIRHSEYFKPEFTGMSKVLGELTSLIPGMDEMPEQEEIMYVLSNHSNTNGASVIMDIYTLKDIYKQIGEFVMIPSSIHEWIIIRKRDAQDLDEIRSMINEVNSTQVDPRDQMSDHPYTFDGEVMHCYE